MTADPVAGLEHRDVMSTIEQVRAGEPGDPAADDSDLHVGSVSGGDLRTMRLPIANCTRAGSFDNGHKAAMNSAGKAISSGRSLSLAKM